MPSTTIYKQLTAHDIFTDTTKVTKGVFAGGAGSLDGQSLYSASVSASNKTYYLTLSDGVTTASNKIFDITYGNFYASGSDLSSGFNSSVRETEAIYKQFANVLLDDPYAKFTFSDVSGSDTGDQDNHIWAVTVKTDKQKDRVNTNWTLLLSSSVSGDHATGAEATALQLTTYTTSKYPSIAGHYYKVISGSAGAQAKDSDLADPAGELVTFGHFYPALGTIIFSGTQLSASVPGSHTQSGSLWDEIHTGSGFAPDTRTDGNASNVTKMFHAIRSGSVIMRSEQDLNQTTYYCRMYHNEFNFSSNPTYILSGSTLGDIIPDMVGAPTSYVAGIGLYNSFNELIAVAQLNVGQKKNYNTELTIAAKLDG
tara:strand:+ start:511 stop:1614 length:1104 start_codon:yes stop_codon:yes gene_type:complete